MEAISKILLMLVLFLCVDISYKAHSILLPSRTTRTSPLLSSSAQLTTLLLILYKSSSVCVKSVPTIVFNSTPSIELRRRHIDTTSVLIDDENVEVKFASEKYKDDWRKDRYNKSSVSSSITTERTYSSSSTGSVCRDIIVNGNRNYDDGKQHLPPFFRRNKIQYYQSEQSSPSPLPSLQHTSQEINIFGYKIFNPFTVFERISGYGGSSSSDIEALSEADVSDSSTHIFIDGEESINKDYYNYDESSDNDNGYYYHQMNQNPLANPQDEEIHRHALKLLCTNTTINQVNKEFTARQYNKYVYLLLQKCRNENNSTLQLEQFENIYHLEWSHSEVDDGQLANVFMSFMANFEYLEYLDLTDNRISCMHWVRSQIVRRLKVLTLTANRINSELCDLSSLHHMNLLIELRLDDNHLETLQGGRFLSNLSELKSLNLTRNRLMDLPRHTFNGVFKLQRLYIAHNSLRVLPFQLFRSMPELRILDLSHNSLLSFPENFFAPNEHLVVLRLRWNHLQTLGKNVFYNLRSLVHLDLAHNDIDHIDRKAFESLQSLITLNISMNNITTVSSILFQSLQNLQQLDLSNNPLKQLPAGLFMSQRNLISLRLDGTLIGRLNNMISRTEPNHVDGGYTLKHLTYLSMQNNPHLQLLSRTLFINAPNIRILLLSNNSLRLLPQEIESLRHLEHFNVARNNLTYLPESLRYLPHLRYINILHNDYICDCKLYWLANWLLTINNTMVYRVKSNTNNIGTTRLDEAEWREYDETWSSVPFFLEQNLNLLISSLKCRHGYKGDMIAILKTLSCTVPLLQNATESRMYELHTTAKLDCTFTGSPSPDVIWVNEAY